MFIVYDDNMRQVILCKRKQLRVNEFRVELETVKEKLKLPEELCEYLNSTV